MLRHMHKVKKSKKASPNPPSSTQVGEGSIKVMEGKLSEQVILSLRQSDILIVHFKSITLLAMERMDEKGKNFTSKLYKKLSSNKSFYLKFVIHFNLNLNYHIFCYTLNPESLNFRTIDSCHRMAPQIPAHCLCPQRLYWHCCSGGEEARERRIQGRKGRGEEKMKERNGRNRKKDKQKEGKDWKITKRRRLWVGGRKAKI